MISLPLILLGINDASRQSLLQESTTLPYFHAITDSIRLDLAICLILHLIIISLLLTSRPAGRHGRRYISSPQYLSTASIAHEHLLPELFRYDASGYAEGDENQSCICTPRAASIIIDSEAIASAPSAMQEAACDSYCSTCPTLDAAADSSTGLVVSANNVASAPPLGLLVAVLEAENESCNDRGFISAESERRLAAGNIIDHMGSVEERLAAAGEEAEAPIRYGRHQELTRACLYYEGWENNRESMPSTFMDVLDGLSMEDANQHFSDFRARTWAKIRGGSHASGHNPFFCS